MNYGDVICVIAAEWGEGGVEAQGRAVLEAGAVPRIAVEAGRLWADGRGIRFANAVAELRRVLRQGGARGVRCGVAQTPVAAWAAASQSADARDTGAVGDDEDTRVVEAGTDREFLAPLGLECLEPDPRLRALLEGVGIVTCGQLAAVTREAIEVRFGGEAVAVWRLARAEDRRTLFGPIPRERPHASLDFVDYVVSDAEQLLFTANALVGNLCGQLNERGEHARALRLDLTLANGECWSRVLQPARPTASRVAWLRLARPVLERLSVPDAVAGVKLWVEATEAASTVQGDLFDAGFATAGAVDAALARLLETQGPVLVRPEPVAHPLPERGIQFRAATFTSVADAALGHAPPPPPAGGRSSATTPRAANATSAQFPLPIRSHRTRLPSPSSLLSRPPFDVPRKQSEAHSASGAAAVPPGLTLQLLPRARPVRVETTGRRDHLVPVRFRDGCWVQLITVAGPDRISGGTQEEPYAREYFQGVTAEGTLVLLFHDARADTWYLHGWWD